MNSQEGNTQVKRALLISQSQDGSYINILNQSLKELNCVLTVVSGKLPSDIDADVEKIESVKYDSTSFSSRLKTWMGYVSDVKSYLKVNIDKYDLVIFTSNPPVNQRLVHYVQKRKKSTVYLVWDIYPNAIEKAFGKKVLPISLVWRWQNRKIYHRCNCVFTIGEVMKEVLVRDYPGLNVEVIPYHTDTTFIHPIAPKENYFYKDNHLDGKTVFMYSGKMGFGHGFNEILEAATILKDRDDIWFMLIGFGAAFEDIKKYVRDMELHNIVVLPYQPLEVLPYSLSSADVSFITIKSNNDGLFLPSKVYDAMASGAAILCISDGQNDVSRIIKENELGVNVFPGQTNELVDAIVTLAEDKQMLERYKHQARLTAEKYDIEKIKSMYTELFASLL